MGSKEAGYRLCGFDASKPVIMVVGGSLGSAAVNQAVRDVLPELLKDFQVVHLCGKEKMDNLLLTTAGYKQFEYIRSEMKDVFAMADIVIDEDDLTNKLLLEKIQELYFNRFSYIDAMTKSNQRDAIGTIIGLIENAVNEK